MKKVLVFGMTENPGGIESFLLSYIRACDRTKLQFDFLCNTSEVAYEEELKTFGKVYRVPARRDGRRQFERALAQLFEQHGREYDAIWVNVCSLANIDYLFAAKRCGIAKRIIHCHNADNGDSFLRGLLHRVNRLRIRQCATDFWSCSDDASQWFYGKNFRKLPNYRLIYNAIDPAPFAFDERTREEYRKKLGWENSIVIGHVGRFHFQKNHKFLVDVFHELWKRDDRYRLLLIGQGETQEAVRQQAEKLDLPDAVRFLGVRSDVAAWYQAMDLFLFPSVFEGLPVTLLEVQANGLPAVVSDAVGKQVRINENIYFRSLSESPASWAEFIDREIKGQKRAGARNFAASVYDIHRQAGMLADLFERGDA